MISKYSYIIFIIGGVLLAVGSVMRLIYHSFDAAKFFTAGAAFVVIYHLVEAMKVRKEGKYQTRRLYGLVFLMSALTLLPAAYFLSHWKNTWLVFLLMYCVIVLFLSFRKEK